MAHATPESGAFAEVVRPLVPAAMWLRLEAALARHRIAAE